MLAKLKQRAAKHLKEKNWNALGESCMELMQVEPEDHNHCLNLARCFANVGDQAKELATLTIGERKYPNETEKFAARKVVLFARDREFEKLAGYVNDLSVNFKRIDIQKVLATIPRDVSDEEILGNLIPRLVVDESQEKLIEGCARLLASRNLFKESKKLLDKIKKPNVNTWIYRGRVCSSLGLIVEAQTSFDQASELICTTEEQVLFLRAKSDSLMRELKHNEAFALLEQATKLNPLDRAANQAAYTQLLYLDDSEKVSRLEQHARLWEQSLSASPTVYKTNRKSSGCLKLGFISHGFKVHPVGWMLAGLLVELNKLDDVEVYIFDLAPTEDYIARTVQAVATSHKDVTGLNNDNLYEEIKRCDLDVLIDCDGYQQGNRLETICKKPAPVIIKWVGGLAASMHNTAFDYLITDPYQTPPKLCNMFSEQLIFMPHCYVTYTPPPYSLTLTTAPHHANGFITFGCLNNAAKITETCICLWSEILNRIKSSKLLMKDKLFDSPELISQVTNRFEEKGIDKSRLIFKGGTHHTEHLRTHDQIDIALDPIPYSGGLCTLEALYMGVPVVALAGELLCHRHSVTHLTQVGASELIGKDYEDYMEIAINLALDEQEIDRHRDTLRVKLINSPLYDHMSFAKSLIAEIKKAAL